MADYSNVVQGIAQFEGYGIPGSIAATNNNPGNLVYGTFAKAYGAVSPDSKGFAVFPTAEAGFSAANALVNSYAQKGFSISDLIDKWAPVNAPGNDPASHGNYIDFLSNSLNASPDTRLSTLAKDPGMSTSSGSWVDQALAGLKVGIGIGMSGGDPKTVAAVASAKTPGDFVATLFGLTIGRAAAFILGILFIAGGIYLFAVPDGTGRAFLKGYLKP